MKKWALLILLTASIYTQELSNFVQKAINHNIQLQRSNASINAFKLELLQSKGDLYPDLDFQSRYSRAGGGRTIDFPIGDLLNPVYSGLFALTSDPAFNIQLENENIRFLRSKEHDTKLSLTQIIDYRLWLVKDIKKEQLKLSQTDKEKITTQIIQDVINTYLSIAQLENILVTLKQNLTLLNENDRTTKALFKSDLVNKAAVLESELQITSLKKDMLDIDKKLRIARKYLNHLVQEDLNKPISVSTPKIDLSSFDKTELLSTALSNRQDLKLIHHQHDIAEISIDINDAAQLPQFIIKADYGYQGPTYQFDNKSDYWMISGILNYNIFNGLSDKHAKEASVSRLMEIKLFEKDIRQKIDIEVESALLDYNLNKEQINLSEKQLALAIENYRIVQKKYEQGLANQLEYQNAFTFRKNAQINYETDKIELIKSKYSIHVVCGTIRNQFNKD